MCKKRYNITAAGCAIKAATYGCGLTDTSVMFFSGVKSCSAVGIVFTIAGGGDMLINWADIDHLATDTVCGFAEALTLAICGSGGASGSPSIDAETSILCNPVDGSPVVSVLKFDSLGAPILPLVTYNLDGSTYSGATPVSCASSQYESEYISGCAAGLQYTQWHILKDGADTGLIYYRDASGAVVPSPAGFVPGPCAQSATIPAYHLVQNQGNGTVTPPFTAQAVKVTYRLDDIQNSGASPISVLINGVTVGNATIRCYINNTESSPIFSTPTITSVVISGAVSATVDVEFFNI